ncbi:MAG: GIY-YIG nuclease family protein [Alphaproteobacteria bacterium]|nr:MAG: GIY-YIG nuclease family protein [Alphaproteobacteria bacterium]
MKRYGVYIMCSRARDGALYTGMSGYIPGRAEQHAGLKEGGAKWALKYKARHLVYYEIVNDYLLAREREEKIKKYDRAVKLDMIGRFNPAWTDLREDLAWKLAQ